MMPRLGRAVLRSFSQILATTNSLQGASHALLASLGSCARRVGYCGVSLRLFLGLPVDIFHLTPGPQNHIMFANILSRCNLPRKGCILPTEPGSIPDVREAAKAREARPGANSLPSNQRCSLCSPGACQATHVLEKGRQCFDFGDRQATP